ncbi:conjugal transfer protein TraN [Diaphorobacter sp. J5-51]|uniref:conjugal transfer protein TraN n=1 Tax=Diaphorobacter sp. J5-51 TaxID=680496 RepID=UPI0006433C52|nr:conjugal transfer protein TraN [Diaphorobacter sp. J5-51]KLR59016.1 hypothetical protein OX89_04180 [Diaphorobacter sp. J5-51]
MESKKLAWPMRMVAYLMLFIATSVWPASWHIAYAGGLPQGLITPDSGTSWSDEAWVVSEANDDLADRALINKRAARLLRGDGHDLPLRGPRLDSEPDKVRLPNIKQDPDEEAYANKQALKIKELTTGEVVNAAQRNSDAAQEMVNEIGKDTLETKRAEPDENQTTKGRFNANEMVPGFNNKEVADMHAMGTDIYNSPEKLKGLAEQNKRNIRRDGCRKTQFVAKELQNIDLAQGSPEHRILKVEFFDIVQEPIAGTNPVEYQSVTKPTTYKRGTVDMLVPTIGGGSTIYWDKIDETYTIKYTYTPFNAPKNRNYFTHNHWFAVDKGAGIERVYNPGLVSYGSPKDGWKPVASNPIQLGVKAAYLSADLYSADVTYTQVAEGQPCPPDPPQQCEVPSVGGNPIRWCPDALGASIVQMYDDQANPNDRAVGKKVSDLSAINTSKKDYRSDPELVSGMIRGLNASSSAKAQELAGSCRRSPISSITIDRGKSYAVPDMQLCSETLVNPYPNGCKNIQRSFGLTYIGEHNFLTVRAFNKIKVPIIDPMTNKQAKDADGKLLYTYARNPANVKGPIKTDFTIMGGAVCPGGQDCTSEKLPDDPYGSSEGYYVEYSHTPMGGDYKAYAFDGVYVQAGGTGNFTNYGKPDQAWKPTGTAAGDDTLHQLKLMAKAYSVPINTFAGCEKYMQYVADGFCQGGKLTCKVGGPTRTVGGVTFGPNLPNSGIVDILKKWGTDASAVQSPIVNGEGAEPTPNGPPIALLDDPMCWEAEGESFTSCSTLADTGTLKHFFKNNGEEWATDCNITPDPQGTPLESSGMCKRTPGNDSCDSRYNGVFTGVCYNPSLSYDCGKEVQGKMPVLVEEQGDSCTGALRCMGTECHRPNLTGNHGEDFAKAMSGMEALNFMMNEMICDETGQPPKSVDEPCTPMVFGGKPSWCKIPVGNEIGITPNCCKDAKEATKSGPGWEKYLLAYRAMQKIGRNETFQKFMAEQDVYNQTAKFFGQIAEPFEKAYASASKWVSENVISPFQAGFDHLFGPLSNGAGSTVAETGVGAIAKQAGISGAIDELKQKLMQNAYEILNQIAPGIGDAIFTSSSGVVTGMTESAKQLLEQFNTVMTVYSMAKLIGHIIFACKQEEYEWGQNDNWRLCSYAGDCCSKKALFVCVEKRKLYCCYKSIATRIMSEQIVKQNLSGTRPFGYRTRKGGGSLGKCDINCGGFTPLELASVDWARVDLSEWTDAMVESGMLNPADPRQNFGVTSDSVPLTNVIGGVGDTEGKFDQRSAAFKTAEGWKDNMSSISGFSETLRSDGVEPCYDDKDDKKMPFTYPGCQKTPAAP